MNYKQYYNKNNMLSINQDAKTSKGTKKGYLTAILYLIPHKLSGKNVCAFASPGCIKTCLNIAGRGKFNTIQKARLNKTLFFLNHKKAFMLNLVNRINNFVKLANKKGLIPVVRLNGTSDIPFENIKIKDNKNIMELFPSIQFYDYSKYPLNKRKLASNYDLTFSLAENNWDNAKHYLNTKTGRVSAVFSHSIPSKYKGYKVIDGDNTDLRFLEPKGCIIGLKFKGSVIDRIKGINSGFVIYNNKKGITCLKK
jgi:hypothetical protein